MNKHRNRQDEFELLRKINKNPKSSQRELAKGLGFSLGKLNYCLNALKDKGLIKIKNFEKNPNKLNYIYILIVNLKSLERRPSQTLRSGT